MVEELKWDSDFFAIRVGKAIINTQKSMDDLLSQKDNLSSLYDLLYVFSKTGLELSLSNAILIDQKVVYSLNISSPCGALNDNIIDYQSDALSPDLVELALASGEFSRFKLDKNFPKDTYEKLYTCWIDQSIKHIIATEVFCYMNAGSPVGLLTLKRNGNSATIGLVATNSKFRGRGIGRALLTHTKNYCFNKGVNTLTVATQLQNKPACSLYTESGFTISQCNDIWHWWL